MNVTGEWVLENVSPVDGGNYSCKTRHSQTASVIIHVVTGKYL